METRSMETRSMETRSNKRKRETETRSMETRSNKRKRETKTEKQFEREILELGLCLLYTPEEVDDLLDELLVFLWFNISR